MVDMHVSTGKYHGASHKIVFDVSSLASVIGKWAALVAWRHVVRRLVPCPESRNKPSLALHSLLTSSVSYPVVLGAGRSFQQLMVRAYLSTYGVGTGQNFR